jgi:predicted dehydrogenase
MSSASPSGTLCTAKLVEALLAGGKHVLCEKPLAPTPENAETLVTAAEGVPHKPQSGYVPHLAGISAIRPKLNAGTIGRALHFNGRYRCDYARDPRAPMG